MKNVLIIGMGEFGKHLADQLVKMQNQVCIIDNDPHIINMLSNSFDNAYVGDCMQKITLQEFFVSIKSTLIFPPNIYSRSFVNPVLFSY